VSKNRAAKVPGILGPPTYAFTLACPYCNAEVEVATKKAHVAWKHDGCPVDPDGEIHTSLPTDERGRFLPPREA
jgi:hypothetical protein